MFVVVHDAADIFFVLDCLAEDFSANNLKFAFI